MQMIRTDHLTNIKIIQNAVENAAKICIVRSAYNKLLEHLVGNPDDLNDPEYIILLGYIMAIFGYRYEFRPYMINPKLE